MRKLIYLIPLIMFAITLYSCYFSINYVVLGNILGNSILANIWLYYIVFDKRNNYCKISKMMPFLLTIINLIDIAGVYIDYEKYSILLKTTISIISISVIIFKIKSDEL